MRNFILAVILMGIFVGAGHGVVFAQATAESPNYSLQYLEENSPPSGAVLGEEQAQVSEQQAPLAATLPATNPPYIWIMAGALALIIGLVVYLTLR